MKFMSTTLHIYERRLLEVKRTPLLISCAREPVLSAKEIHARIRAVAPFRNKAGSRPPPHWGINE